MSAGINPPTPEALQRFSRWMDAMRDAMSGAKREGDWTECDCELCRPKRYIAIQRRMPPEFQP